MGVGVWVTFHNSCVWGIVEPPTDGSNDIVTLFLDDDPDTRDDVGESAVLTGPCAHETWLRIVGDLYEKSSKPAANTSIGMLYLFRCGRTSSDVTTFFTDLSGPLSFSSSSLGYSLFARCSASSVLTCWIFSFNPML
jgi:hypothetical protein